MRRLLLIILKGIAIVVVVPPLLLLATCTYTSFSPHLRSDPLLLALMDAPRHDEVGWRTADVQLIPRLFEQAQAQAAVEAKLTASGFELFADYSTETATPDPYPDDGMDQALLDRWFAEQKSRFNELGITHIYERDGRARPACGESLFVEIGLINGSLTQATGYSRWTCL